MNEINNRRRVNQNRKHPQSRENRDNNGHRRPKVKKKRSNGLKKLLIIITFIIMIFVILFVIRMCENGWTYGGLLATFLGHNKNTVNNLDTVYIVVTGESQNLTDTIMVCAFDPLYNKSPETLINRINSITGLDFRYYINVDTKGLRELVDAIGGIYYEVPMDMDYDDDTQDLHIHLKAGYQLLDGNKAEQLVRFRHNNDGTSYPASYGDNDLGRMRTQREFLKELLKQMKSKHLIINLGKYISIAKNNVETNCDIDKMKHYLPYLIDFNLEDLDSCSLPGEPEKCNGVWLYIPNKAKIKELVDEKFNSLK